MFAPKCVCQRLEHVFLLRYYCTLRILPACSISGCCPLLCVFKYYFPHCRYTVYRLQAGFIVVSRSLSPVSPTSILQRWPVTWRGVLGLGQQSSYQDIESAYSGESWTIYIKSLHACWPYLISFRKANQFSLSDDFRPGSPSFWCFDCLVTSSSPTSVFIRWCRFCFLYVRTSSAGTYSRYRKYAQQ